MNAFTPALVWLMLTLYCAGFWIVVLKFTAYEAASPPFMEMIAPLFLVLP